MSLTLRFGWLLFPLTAADINDYTLQLSVLSEISPDRITTVSPTPDCYPKIWLTAGDWTAANPVRSNLPT